MDPSYVRSLPPPTTVGFLNVWKYTLCSYNLIVLALCIDRKLLPRRAMPCHALRYCLRLLETSIDVTVTLQSPHGGKSRRFHTGYTYNSFKIQRRIGAH